MRVKQCNRVFPRFVLGALLKLRRLIRRQPDRVFLAIQPDAAAERREPPLNAVNCSSIRCSARIT